MKKCSSLLTILFFLAGFEVKADAFTTFTLLWENAKLPLNIELFEALNSFSDRVAENGILNSKVVLPASKLVKDGKVTISSGRSAILILKLTNLSNEKIDFSVAPHATSPGDSALGFSFNCLCNGHIYYVGPKESWYRIMKLTDQSKTTELKNIILRHEIFAVKKPKI